MRLLQFHIGVSVVNAVMLVLLIIVGLNALGMLVDQLRDMKGGYTFIVVIEYVCWYLPGMMAKSLSFATMIGCLLGLGVLANHNELTVLRASGISLLQIVTMVLIPVVFLMGLGMGLDELSTYTDRHAEDIRTLAMEKKLNGKREAKLVFAVDQVQDRQVWNRDGNEFIRFDQVLLDGYVMGITRVSLNDQGEISALIRARSGLFVDRLWHLKDVEEYQFIDGVVDKSFQREMLWKTDLTPERLEYVAREPENLTVGQLTDYKVFLQGQGRDSRAYELEYWKKILKPAALISLVLLAISFVFGSLRQVTVSQRVFLGVLVGVSFHILQDITGTASLVFGFNPLSGVVAPIVVCALVGLILLQRVR